MSNNERRAYMNMCKLAGIKPSVQGMVKFKLRLRANGIRF